MRSPRRARRLPRTQTCGTHATPHFFRRSRRLEDAGVGVGRRALELACWRERSSKRETRVRGILQFITQARAPQRPPLSSAAAVAR